MTTNLLSQLLPEGVDDHELLNIISSHFSSGRSTPRDEVDYPNADAYAVRIRHKRGRVVDIQPGPAWTNDLLETLKERIHSDLVQSPGVRIQRCIAFASQPVKSFFRSGDRLQMLPAPDNAPQPPQLYADHPFVLEFPIRTSQNGLISMGRRTRGMLEWTWFLNAVLQPSIKVIGPRHRRMWALCQNDPTSGLTQEHVRFAQEFYTVDGFVGDVPDFSEPNGKVAATTPEAQYYSPKLRVIDEFDVPDCLPQLIETFANLSNGDRTRFLRAIHWISVANDHWETHASSYFIALVAALEALLPPAGTGEKCVTCKRDIGPGPTQRFHDFVEQFLPSTSWAVNKKNLYKIRSDLAHGWRMLDLDEMPWSGSLNTTGMQDRQAWTELTHTVRLVLVNWLKTRSA